MSDDLVKRLYNRGPFETADCMEEAAMRIEDLEDKLEKAEHLLLIYTDPMAMTDEDEAALAELTAEK